MKKYFYEILLIITAAVWGLSFPAAKYVAYDFDSITFLLIRFTAASILLAIVFGKELKHIKKRMIFPSVLVGMLLAFHTFIQLEGMRYTSAGNSAFITSTNIIFVPLFSFYVFKGKVEKRLIHGLILVISGFLFVSGIITVFPFGINLTSINYGDLLTLICAIFVGIYFVFFSYLTIKYNEMAVNVLHMFGAALGTFIIWIFYPGKAMNFSDPVTVMWTLYCALISTAVGFWLLSKAQAKVSASKVSVICSLESVFALLFAAVIPGRNGLVEPITVSAALGGFLILSGIIKISKK